MTTIAADGISVCTDSQRTLSTGEIIDFSSKKMQRAGGYLFAATGDFALIGPAIEWFLKGADPQTFPCAGKDPDVRLLVFYPDRIMSYSNAVPYADPYPYPQAFGSGASFAMGALFAGKTAREAIEIASQLCAYTGGPIHEEQIPKAVREAAE